MEVKLVVDRHQIHAFLKQDRLGNVYQLGYLDDAYFQWCEWYGAFEGEDLVFLMLLYSGLSIPVVLTVGDAAAVKPVLDAYYHKLPDRFHCHLREEHLPGFREFYNTSRLKSTLRLTLERGRYKSAPVDPNTLRLGHRDTAAIVALYEHYPDNLFEPYQLETGLYFGYYRVSGGDLISIAGIHTVSEVNDVAVVGNLVTHPKYRGKNLALRVLGRLLNELFERVSFVALNVPSDNIAAQKTLEHFKFRRHHSFWQGLVKRAF